MYSFSKTSVQVGCEFRGRVAKPGGFQLGVNRVCFRAVFCAFRSSCVAAWERRAAKQVLLVGVSCSPRCSSLRLLECCLELFARCWDL